MLMWEYSFLQKFCYICLDSFPENLIPQHVKKHALPFSDVDFNVFRQWFKALKTFTPLSEFIEVHGLKAKLKALKSPGRSCCKICCKGFPANYLHIHLEKVHMAGFSPEKSALFMGLYDSLSKDGFPLPALLLSPYNDADTLRQSYPDHFRLEDQPELSDETTPAQSLDPSLLAQRLEEAERRIGILEQELKNLKGLHKCRHPECAEGGSDAPSVYHCENFQSAEASRVVETVSIESRKSLKRCSTAIKTKYRKILNKKQQQRQAAILRTLRPRRT